VQVMVAKASIRVASLVISMGCAALCQQLPAPSSLPDAPSVVASTRVEKVIEEVPSLSANGNRGATPKLDLGDASWSSASTLATLYKREPAQKSSNDFFAKYLYPSLAKRNLNYHPSTSDSFMGRAMYATSRIFVTRDESGKGRVNTSYFVGVLSSAALHMAYRPYWNRSATAPFSDFGSTIGNDAGMNLLHEFKPGLQQLMKSHAPKFVEKIAERVGHN